MKYHLLNLFRQIGMLKAMDWCKFGMHRLKVAGANSKFVQEFPEFAVPPYSLAFDAYNSVAWRDYRDVGKLHGKVFADIINARRDSGDIRVLDWGCGPARIIRHIPALLNGPVKLVGIDYNEDSIAWCQQHFPEIEFHINGPMPPTSLPADNFDFTYNFSVLTHLSAEAQLAWVAELYRVLRPGGWLICTTHGNNYRHLLTSESEQQAYARGDVVIQGGYREGKKWFLAIHPEEFVRNKLLADFESVEQVAVDSDARMLQDVWVARKPVAAET